jgi:prepilin-type processing-associated H-X9-DG protein
MSAQEQARQTQCAKQMKDLAGANLAHAMKKGRFPGWQEFKSPGNIDTWVVRILPYLDMQQEFRNASLRELDPIFYCPSNPPESTDPTKLALGYRCNIGSGADGVFVDRGADPQGNTIPVMGLEDIRDGKKNTLLLSESAQVADTNWNTQSSPDVKDLGFSYNNSDDTAGAQALNKVDSTAGAASSFHQEGFNVAYCDGHTDFFYFPQVSDDTSQPLTTDEMTMYQAYKAKMTPNGGD